MILVPTISQPHSLHLHVQQGAVPDNGALPLESLNLVLQLGRLVRLHPQLLVQLHI